MWGAQGNGAERPSRQQVHGYKIRCKSVRHSGNLSLRSGTPQPWSVPMASKPDRRSPLAPTVPFVRRRRCRNFSLRYRGLLPAR